MIVLHALWTPREGLRIWGEHASAPAPRRRRSSEPSPHPFACPAGDLHAALGGETAEPAKVVVLLPSDSRSPAPSPELAQHGDLESPQALELVPWTVPACTLDATAAAELLLDLDSARGTRVATGRSLAYLAGVAAFALELTARGRILPSLERRNGDFVACWRPSFTDASDAARLPILERAMPPSCRAETEWPATPQRAASKRRAFPAPPAASAVLADALRVLTDACARAALPALPLPITRRRPESRRAGDEWLRALAGPEGRVVGEGPPLAALQERLEQWIAVAEPDPRQRFRTCFRLSAPEEDGGTAAETSPGSGTDASWRLDFLLQRVDDPSLMIPAEDIWSGNGAAGALLQGSAETPQEWLLGDLGRARRHFPVLETALQSAAPAGLDLDANGAHSFMSAAVPLLKQAGFGVLVPPWWQNTDTRLGLRLQIRSPDEESSSSGLLGLGAICAYHWRLALGDDMLSAEEFQAIAARKQSLMRLRGRWVVLRPEDIDGALRLLQSKEAEGTMTAVEALRLASGAAPAGAAPDLPIRGIDAAPGVDGGLAALLSGEDRMEPVAPPADFHGVLRPYQQRGLAWLSFLDRHGIGACLADDMGLGKTIQLLALLLSERTDRGAPPPPTLLICPMSVVGNWQHEAAKFAPSLRVLVHHGSGRQQGEEFGKALDGVDLVITTYALAARDRDTLAAVAWNRVALDEAQNIKNSSARQSRAIRSLSARGRIALTGTPVENRLTELWSIMDFLNPGLLGSARDFRQRFASPIERGRDDEQAERLRRLTRPFILRRLKTDRSIIRDLPAKQEMKIYCNLTREQASLYQGVVDDMLRRVEESDGIERRGLILATMMKLKQVCNHPVQLLQDRSALPGRSGKLALLEEILGEALDIGDRCLVFTQFAEMGLMLQRHLRRQFRCEVLYLHGRTSRKARDEMVERFQTGDGPPVFILSLKAGGTGLNLTAANQVIHFDRWWNPAVENQATDRAFRIGQRRRVQVRTIVCTGTLEERIDLMMERKKDLAERIVGAGEGWLTELSTAELREVVRLSTDAVSE